MNCSHCGRHIAVTAFCVKTRSVGKSTDVPLTFCTTRCLEEATQQKAPVTPPLVKIPEWNIARIVIAHDCNNGQIPKIQELIAQLEAFHRDALKAVPRETPAYDPDHEI